MKRVVWICLGMILFLSSGCMKENTIEKNKVHMYTSSYPLEDFAKKIGKEHVSVENVIPPGTDPHDYELTAKELVKLSKADILVYNGAGLESWITKTIKNLSSKTLVVNSSGTLDIATRNGEQDPHVWLDPMMAADQALKIRDALIKIDARHQDAYEKNYQALLQQFESLDREYKEMVRNSYRKEFVVSHAAFYYMSKRYGLKQIPITGLSPLDEPGPKELHQLMKWIERHKMKHIFFETLANNKLARAIKDELKLQVLTLNPLEGLTKEELDQGADYFSMMRKNKEQLKIALGKS